jgi:hypothetical protein
VATKIYSLPLSSQSCSPIGIESHHLYSAHCICCSAGVSKRGLVIGDLETLVVQQLGEASRLRPDQTEAKAKKGTGETQRVGEQSQLGREMVTESFIGEVEALELSPHRRHQTVSRGCG